MSHETAIITLTITPPQPLLHLSFEITQFVHLYAVHALCLVILDEGILAVMGKFTYITIPSFQYRPTKVEQVRIQSHQTVALHYLQTFVRAKPLQVHKCLPPSQVLCYCWLDSISFSQFTISGLQLHYTGFSKIPATLYHIQGRHWPLRFCMDSAKPCSEIQVQAVIK